MYFAFISSVNRYFAFRLVRFLRNLYVSKISLYTVVMHWILTTFGIVIKPAKSPELFYLHLFISKTQTCTCFKRVQAVVYDCPTGC